MLNWHISVNRGRGCFEGDDLEKVIKSMIKYYAEDDRSPEQITMIAAYDDEGEILQQASDMKIREINERVEEEVEEWRKEIASERENQRQIRSEYRASLI